MDEPPLRLILGSEAYAYATAAAKARAESDAAWRHLSVSTDRDDATPPNGTRSAPTVNQARSGVVPVRRAVPEQPVVVVALGVVAPADVGVLPALGGEDRRGRIGADAVAGAGADGIGAASRSPRAAPSGCSGSSGAVSGGVFIPTSSA